MVVVMVFVVMDFVVMVLVVMVFVVMVLLEYLVVVMVVGNGFSVCVCDGMHWYAPTSQIYQIVYFYI